MRKQKESDSDDFDFDDDEDQSDSGSSKKKSVAPSYGIGSKSKSGGTLDVDDLITKLLSTKARNIGALDDLKEDTIIQLIDKARDLFT